MSNRTRFHCLILLSFVVLTVAGVAQAQRPCYEPGSSWNEDCYPLSRDSSDASKAKKELGRFAITGIFGFGVGSAHWKGDSRIATALQGGVAVGWLFKLDPVYFQLDAVFTSSHLSINDWASLGELVIRRLGLVPRLMAPLIENTLYLGAELDLGVGISSLNYLYASARGVLSIFPIGAVEIKLALVGIDALFDLGGDGVIISSSSQVGLAVRF